MQKIVFILDYLAAYLILSFSSSELLNICRMHLAYVSASRAKNPFLQLSDVSTISINGPPDLSNEAEQNIASKSLKTNNFQNK